MMNVKSRALKKFISSKIAMSSLIVVVGYVLMALLCKMGLIFKDVGVIDNANAFLGFSWQHPFGTDVFGRDIFARAAHGTVTALSVGFVSSFIALVIGLTLGSVSGYFGGRVDAMVSWLYTTIDSVPFILLIPALSFILGKGLTNLYIALGLTGWVTLCRMIRAEVMKQKSKEYVEAAKVLGSTHARIIFKHILPNVMHLAFIQFGLGFVGAIKTEVILSYLGLGVDPTTPSWGIMIDDAKLEIPRAFFGNLLAASVFMFVLILAFNFLNESIKESLDPNLKNR
jgi:ABC-type dipeptide/oligopeptide/nickel transport system permease subunit